MNQDIHDAIKNIIANGSANAARWLKANTAGKGIKRRAYMELDKHLRSFAMGVAPKSWLVMPGLRGTGKTTLLTQLYCDEKLKDVKKFLVSLDQVKLVGGTVVDAIQVIEELLEDKIENIDQPIALLLDEVQYMSEWGLALKTIYDRASRIFIVCTGSSALLLQRNPDVSRRVDIIKIHPLCFTEYVMIKQAQQSRVDKTIKIKMPAKGLSEKIRTALFDSTSAVRAFLELSSLKDEVDGYWQGLNKQELTSEYLKYGTLPFTLTIPDETIIWSRVSQLMSDVLVRDVSSLNMFDTNTIASLDRILFILASSNQVSMNQLSSMISMNLRTVMAVLDAFEKTEIITKILPKGSAHTKVKKPSKYLFTSPAMRAALCRGGSILTESMTNLKGSLLEDLVGLYFKRIFMDSSIRANVEYDYAQGGADFILSKDGTKENSIVIEVGINKRTAKQIELTQKGIGGKYGLIITNPKLQLNSELNVVFIPLEYFLLA